VAGNDERNIPLKLFRTSSNSRCLRHGRDRWESDGSEQPAALLVTVLHQVSSTTPDKPATLRALRIGNKGAVTLPLDANSCVAASLPILSPLESLT